MTSATKIAFNAAATAAAIRRSEWENPSPPIVAKLTGSFGFIRAKVKTHRNLRFKNTMATKLKAMLDVVREICRHQESQAEINGEIEDKTDLNPVTGKGSRKKFILKNVREIKFP